MDDLFGDLVKTKASEEVPIVLPVPDERKSSVPVPNVFSSTAAETKDEAVGTGTLVTLSKEELERLLQQTVQAAVDATFGKFAKSLRTVLEDMSKRLEANALTQAHQFGELQAALQELDEASAGHAENSNCRFTALDHSIREIDRAVQSMRDRQELHEAQALLAKYEPQADKAAEDKKAAAAAAAAAPAAAAAAPTPAPAAAAPVPSAPAPIAAAPASAPAPLPAPLPAPQAQPAPAPVPMGMPSPAASAPMQQHYQPPQQALGHEAPQPQYAPQPGPAPYGYQAMMPPTGGQQQPQYAPPQQQAPMMQPPQQVPMMPTQQQQQQPMLQMPPPQVQQQQHMPPQQQQQQQQQPQPQQQQPQQAPSGYAPPPQYQQQQAPPSQYAAPQHMQGPPSPHVPAMPHMGMGPQLSGGSMQGMPPGPSMYPTSRMPSYPAPLQQPSYHQQQPGPLTSQGSGGGGPPPQAKATSRAVPLEQVVTDIERMGFDRHRVMALVASMQKAGQPVDLNVIIDKLTRG